MKNKVLSCILAVMMSGALTVTSGYASDSSLMNVSSNFDINSNKFVVNGTVKGSELTWVNVVIVPNKIKDISPENIKDENSVVFKTVRTDGNGNIDVDIDLSDEIIENQRYTYYIFPQNDEIKG